MAYYRPIQNQFGAYEHALAGQHIQAPQAAAMYHAQGLAVHPPKSPRRSPRRAPAVAYGPMPIAGNPGKYGFGVTRTGKSRTKPLGSRSRAPTWWNQYVKTFAAQHKGQSFGGRGAFLKAAAAQARAQGAPVRSPPRSRRPAYPVAGFVPGYGGF